MSNDAVLAALGNMAAAMIPDGATVGLGTGKAANAFIAALADRVRDGLVVSGVPTSAASADQALRAGIPLGHLEEDRLLEITVDGADEVTPQLDLLKGRGGALVRERIVAGASKRQVILVTHDKLVRALGERGGGVPVEIIPLAAPLAMRRLKLLGLRPALRSLAGGPAAFVTENGNSILDCALAAPLAGKEAARLLETALRAIPGVVDTGLFLGTAERVLVGYPDGRVEILRPAGEQAADAGDAARSLGPGSAGARDD